MATFRCIDVDFENESIGYIERHGSTLRLAVDFSIDCKSDGYLWMYTWAVAMALVYIGMIPCMYWLLLWRYRDIICSRNNATFLLKLASSESGRKRIAFVKSIEFIYGAYKPEFWYWEVNETKRNLFQMSFIKLMCFPHVAFVCMVSFVCVNG